MKSKLALLVLLGAATMFAGTRVYVGIGVGGYRYAPPPVAVYAPPPPPPAYYMPPRPGPGYSWVSGYWYPVGRRYHWRAGYWSRPPYARGYWVAPRYHGRYYYPGYWRR